MMWIPACTIVACLVAMAMASENWPTDNVDVTGSDVTGSDVKRSLGAVCRCCTTRLEPWCCNACVFQFRSPTPFYTGKRSRASTEDDKGLDYPREDKRARYRSRSQCGCCFTRRLRWCCESCRRYNPGKRSDMAEVPPPVASELYRDAGDDRSEDRLPPLSALMDSYERNVESESGQNLIDVPAFPLENTRKDCLCCFLYDAVSCCDRCKNAA